MSDTGPGPLACGCWVALGALSVLAGMFLAAAMRPEIGSRRAWRERRRGGW